MKEKKEEKKEKNKKRINNPIKPTCSSPSELFRQETKTRSPLNCLDK
jgi:hypothetical protein